MSGGRYYQLTHDYLVPSLREWLTRKQRETRRGRAELRLKELTASWKARQDLFLADSTRVVADTVIYPEGRLGGSGGESYESGGRSLTHPTLHYDATWYNVFRLYTYRYIYVYCQ